eukprot:COSAG04_NODE_12416_length_654_cov_0.554955_1_plen_46_part_10
MRLTLALGVEPASAFRMSLIDTPCEQTNLGLLDRDSSEAREGAKGL